MPKLHPFKLKSSFGTVAKNLQRLSMQNLNTIGNHINNTIQKGIEQGKDIDGSKKIFTDKASKWTQSSQSEEELRKIFTEKIKYEGAKVFTLPGVNSEDDGGYSLKCLELGIFYSGFVTDNMKIYISYGFFEDNILNLELGFSENIKDLMNMNILQNS